MVAYAASAVTLAMLGVALVRGGRFTPARATLLALIASSLLWVAESVWRLLAQPVDPTLAVAWAMPAAAITVAAVRMLVLAASDTSWRVTPVTMLTFSVHPVATVMVATTPALRELVVVAQADGTFSYGPVFWVHLVASYMFLGSAGLEMFGARARIPVLAKHRPAAMIVAWAVPMTINLARTFFGHPGAPDVTPVGLTLTAGVLYLVVVRGGFADIVPIARAKVFDQLVDAVFVVDTQGNLVDANAKARAMVGLDSEATLAQDVSLADVSPAIAQVADIPGEHDVVCHGDPMVVHIAISNLADQSGRQLGRAIHARDVTHATTQRRDMARLHNELARGAEANEQLRAELADQALRDVGTGLHNRRYIMEVLPGMVEQCEKEEIPLSIVMIDLDHFKDVNDTWGHSVGDRVLAAVANAMQAATPPGLIARFGGEEFVALLPGMTAVEAASRADAIRAACAAVEVRTREGIITLTASAGVAAAGPGNIDGLALIDAADVALYRAKGADRNRTWVATADERNV
jgi:diguanylate cyclase (GGDEF)-like protein